jgi:hypothetical protein
LGVIAVMVTGVMAAGRGRAAGDFPPALAMLLIPEGLVMIGCGIATFVGQIKCASVPEASGARGFASGAALCLVGSVLLSMVSGAAHLPALNALGQLLSFVGTVLFILFIRAAARYLGNMDLSMSAGRYLVFSVCFIVGLVVMIVAAVVGQMPALFAIFGLGILVCGLIMFIWYLRLVQNLMKTIDERRGGR